MGENVVFRRKDNAFPGIMVLFVQKSYKKDISFFSETTIGRKKARTFASSKGKIDK